MPEHLANPYRGRGLNGEAADLPRVVADPAAALALFRRCPAEAPTPLRGAPALASAAGVGALHLKDETGRMGLGSFKALGAVHAIARSAAASADRKGAPADAAALASALAGTVFTCASAGNHGLSVAAGARLFGAGAVVFVAETVPQGFVRRLEGRGARVVREGADYEASMAAAEKAADANGWTLLSDSSWPGYTDWPLRVMEGYLIAAAEIAEQMPEPPTHVFLQAGVGGLAAAMAASVRHRWGDAPTVVVVEPEAAPALIESIRAGRAVTAPGPASTMGRLDCKTPSLLALAELARSADHFVTISDRLAAAAVEALAEQRVGTTPSGAAGVAALLHAGALGDRLGLTRESRALALITEGPEDAP